MTDFASALGAFRKNAEGQDKNPLLEGLERAFAAEFLGDSPAPEEGQGVGQHRNTSAKEMP